MSSAITFSGFNDIDFSSILNALMTQASQPLTDLQTQQTNLGSRISNFKLLATQLSELQTAADDLSTPGATAGFSASSTDSSAVAISAGSSATAGHYDIVVQELARAQVTASASTVPDANTTIVASGGTLTIGGTDVPISSGMTLQQLAAAINSTSGILVSASVIQSSPTTYRLVLTGNSAGTAGAFTVQNSLTGGSGLTFVDTDNNGTSGDTAADNAVSATDASLLVNNILVTSSSNTLDSVIPGSTITLLKKDPTASVGLDVTPDSSALKTNLGTFISAYNSLMTFLNKQNTAAASGDATSIGRDPLVRQLRNTMRAALSSAYGTGSAFDNLSQIGLEFTRTGTLELNETIFSDAVKTGIADINKLLIGDGSIDGAFAVVEDLLKQYTQTSGLLDSAEAQLTNQITRLDAQIENMQARLAAQRAAMQAEFTAADQAMSALNSQSSALTSLLDSLSSSS